MPVYNPEGPWAEEIIEQYEQLRSILTEEVTTQLILVNDGSPNDLTQGQTLLHQALGDNCTWVDYPQNQGKGYALRAGVQQSHAEYIIYTDHDIPYTLESMIRMYKLLDVHAVVIGHRDADYYKTLPFFRVKLSHYLKTINRFILRLNTDDTQCGLKAFRKSVKPIFLETQTNRFLIDIEFLRRLKKAKISVKVVDVSSRPGVIMSTLGLRTVCAELLSYIKIFLRT